MARWHAASPTTTGVDAATNLLAERHTYRVSIVSASQAPRQGILVLLPQEGEQRPLQQDVGTEGSETTIRFRSATEDYIRWTLSEPAPLGRLPREDFRATLGEYTRPPSPRHPNPAAPRAQSVGTQEQMAASAPEVPPAGVPGTGEHVSAVPSTDGDHPSDGTPCSPSLATAAQQPSASPPPSPPDQARAPPPQPQAPGDDAPAASQSGAQGPTSSTAPREAAEGVFSETEHFVIHSDVASQDAGDKEAWESA